MSIFGWIVLILSIGCLLGTLRACHRLRRRMGRLQEALRTAKVQIHNAEQTHMEKERQREGTEERLRNYLQLLDILINTIPNPIYFKDANGHFQGCNKEFAQTILGLNRDKIIGKRPQQMPEQIPPDLAATYQRQEMIMMEKGIFRNHEAPVQCADGRRREFLFSLAPIRISKDEPMGSVTVMSDLTDKNRAAQERLEKEKLEGVLETAGGVCHEFNQPMQALAGYLDLISLKAKSGKDSSEQIKKALMQIERMSAITSKLQRITHYETMDYANNKKIIDIHKSAQ